MKMIVHKILQNNENAASQNCRSLENWPAEIGST